MVDTVEHVAAPADLEHELSGPVPAASAAATWSALPAITRVPARSPVAAAAAGVTAPTTVSGSRTRGSHESGVSVTAKAGAYQPPRRASQKPDSSAQFRSRLHSPVSRWVTRSYEPRMRRIRR